MVRIQDYSIAKKLTWMNMLVSGTALILACTAFIGFDWISFRDNAANNLSTQAQIIGTNTVSALLFNDPRAAGDTLSALRASKNITYAGIYTVDGKPLASYSRNSLPRNVTLPSIGRDNADTFWFDKGYVVLVHPIVSEGKPVGMVYIESDLTNLYAQLRRYIGIAAIVLLVSLLAALLVSSIFRRAVARPIVHLAEIARIVSREKKYSVRATRSGTGGEAAILVDAFNEMLTQIQQRDEALQKAQDELEHRVRERTAELEAAKKEVELFSESVLRAKEELERASKFKDQFLSTMSHELRTPLNAVLGFSDLLTEERYGALNDRQRRYVNHIHTGGKHLLTLINDILDLSKIEADRLQLAIGDVRIDTTFAEACDTLHPLVSKKSHTLVKYPAPELSVRADATRLKQILINLIGNAIKFTPEGGKIEVEAKRAGEFVRIEVRDSGPGIPPDQQKRIFEAFYRLTQTAKMSEGTGLGLAITQRLVELHGGQLGLESQPGLGSCFYFTMPITPTIEAREEPRIEARLGGGAPHIVVVEDDQTVATLLKLQLVSSGYDVTLCAKPECAVEMIAELQPAAVTIDIIMKPINGWELLTTLKSDPRTAHIPVIIVSVVDQTSTGALLGADEYIVKPVERLVLISAVERCLSRTGRADRQSILVVEDHAPTRELIAESLTKCGYAVNTAADGAEARTRVACELPQLVILDLMLPTVSGFELLAEWRASSRTADLPVFILTSKDLTPDEKKYLLANSSSLLRKEEPWQKTLFRQLQRAAPSVLAEKS